MIVKEAAAKEAAKEAAVRQPAVAGRFYPHDARQLDAEVRRHMNQAQDVRLHTVRAVIVPHAGYLCSGSIAGAAFRTLAQAEAPDRVVYVLGPAHWQPVHGVGLSRAAAFATPLGPVPLAHDRIDWLLTQGGQYRVAEEAHTPEHAIEVELPFLQTVLGPFQLVPMLFDDHAEPETVADDLCTLLADRPHDLIVVSSDLSHYHAYQEAVILDHAFLKALAMQDMAAANGGEACGLLPILALMRMAARLHWTPHLLAYANSGDTCGSRREVVGYGAVAYTE